jgi:hypothetical protein
LADGIARDDRPASARGVVALGVRAILGTINKVVQNDVADHKRSGAGMPSGPTGVWTPRWLSRINLGAATVDGADAANMKDRPNRSGRACA